GSGALPESAARIRCYPLTGLDFMGGQLWPNIPALNPKQAVAFRWRLAVSDSSTPLVFSVLISQSARPVPVLDNSAPIGPRAVQAVPEVEIAPQVASVSIPRFSLPPHLLGASAAKTPQAFA